MSVCSDAFRHQPELRGKITDPEASFFRNFNALKTFQDRPELHWVIELLYSDEEREASRAQALADHNGDLWVFAYGSLMWDPAFHFAEVRRATVPGYERKFILKDIYGGRGTPDSPGLMAALDRGRSCQGLLFRIDAEHVDTETEILWRREIIGEGYIPTFVTATTDGEEVSTLTFVADHSTDSMHPDLSFDQQVSMISHGSGFLGSSRDYLANIVDQFATLGIRDDACSDLLSAVDGHLAGS